MTLTLKLATFQGWNPGYHSIEASPQHPLWGVGVCGRAGVGVLSTGGPLYLLKLGAKSGTQDQGLGFGQGTASYSDEQVVARLTDCFFIAQRLAATPTSIVIGDEQPRVLELARRVNDSFEAWDNIEVERGNLGLGGGGAVTARPIMSLNSKKKLRTQAYST